MLRCAVDVDYVVAVALVVDSISIVVLASVVYFLQFD